jgi:hypothetical protein
MNLVRLNLGIQRAYSGRLWNCGGEAIFSGILTWREGENFPK